MRRPEPFYWKARKGWYVQLASGQQVKLGAAERPTATPPDDIMQTYYRLMAGEGLMTVREKRQATVPVIVDLFIQSKEGRRQSTITACLTYLQPFVTTFKARKLETIKIVEVRKWAEGRESWGESTKHMAIVYAKQLTAWAKRTGHIEVDPLAEMTNPFGMQPREKGIGLAEFALMIETTKNPAFATMLRMLRDTGCRPGELCILTAKHLHREKPIATLNPREHKTGERTGRSKTIVFASPVMAELRELAQVYPTGPLLRTVKGLPWNQENLQKRFRRLRDRCGLADHVFPYASRSAFATRLSEMGVAPFMVSKLLGHRNVETTLNNYFKPETEALNEAVDRALGVQAAPKVETPEETLARLLAANPGLLDKLPKPERT